MGSCLLVPDVLSAGADNLADTTPGLASWSMMAIGLLRGGRDYGKPFRLEGVTQSQRAAHLRGKRSVYCAQLFVDGYIPHRRQKHLRSSALLRHDLGCERGFD